MRTFFGKHYYKPYCTGPVHIMKKRLLLELRLSTRPKLIWITCFLISSPPSLPPIPSFFLRPRSDSNSHKALGEGLSCGVTGWDFWSLGFNILLPLLSFINGMFLGLGLSYSLHLCLRHVGGWFLTHGPMCSSDNGGPVSVCLLSCSLSGIVECWCHSTPTHLFYTHIYSTATSITSTTPAISCL